jgi:RNA polymerase sigma-70 factor (ECF subfamily)
MEQEQEQQHLIPHLFRTEFSKITAVLCKRFGIEHIELAEDIASETFLAAVETWSFKGIPDNPVGWLYTVAKNKTRNHLKRNEVFLKKVAPESTTSNADTGEIQIDLSDKNISDSQLQMLFAICHPSIQTEAQIGLALRILCGFGIDEIANAFLTSKDTINKRLSRAKEKLRVEKVPIEFPGAAQIDKRLENVLTTLYLLFNEGYYSESHDAVVRKDLCAEAIRLTSLLISNEQTDQPQISALLSLMCFHSSRFDARKNDNGELILYKDQDTSLWNQELISTGGYYLNRASQGNVLTKYHLEATIAYWHTVKDDTIEKWENILKLYDYLIEIDSSPIAALNRAFAVSKVKGRNEGIQETEKLQLSDNHYYHTLLGELYREIDEKKSKSHFQSALSLAKTRADKETLQKKMDTLF